MLPTDTADLRAAAKRFAELVSPALAAHALGAAEDRLTRPLIDADDRRKSLLLNRFTRHAQLDCMALLDAAGIDAVTLKGFANAHTLYDDPDARVVGDIDVLIREATLEATLSTLAGHGFRFRAGTGRACGFVSDASYLPFVSADGACNLDIHIRPDAYPVHRSLDTEGVFAASRAVPAGGLMIRVPCREHSFLLAASNAAKDKFGPFSARKLLDAVVLLRGPEAVDWQLVLDLARRGRYLRPVRAFLGILVRLGAHTGALPPALAAPFSAPVAGEFERAYKACRDLFPGTLGLLALLRRELLLCTEPTVGLHNNWMRMRGLVRPGSGIPPQARAAFGAIDRPPSSSHRPWRGRSAMMAPSGRSGVRSPGPRRRP